jgi:hypothetical protein
MHNRQPGQDRGQGRPFKSPGRRRSDARQDRMRSRGFCELTPDRAGFGARIGRSSGRRKRPAVQFDFAMVLCEPVLSIKLRGKLRHEREHSRGRDGADADRDDDEKPIRGAPLIHHARLPR